MKFFSLGSKNEPREESSKNTNYKNCKIHYFCGFPKSCRKYGTIHSQNKNY